LKLDGQYLILAEPLKEKEIIGGFDPPG